MPWEQLGGVGAGGPGTSWDLEAWGMEMAKSYLRFASGDPPPGVEVDVAYFDHELGSYPDLSIWYFDDYPSDYIRHCEQALEVFKDAVDWEALGEYLAKVEAEREADAEDEAEDDEDTEDPEYFTVRFSDRFPLIDDDGPTTSKTFDTWEEAVAAARYIVDAWLAQNYEPGTTAAELYWKYLSCRPDPTFDHVPEGKDFPAAEYARWQCVKLCGDGSTESARPD